MPRISVIIPTLNEGTLLATVQRVLETCDDRSDLEVLVVDGNSTDGSIERLEQHFRGTSVEIRVFVEAFASRGAQLQRGVCESRSPRLLCLHADALLPCGWQREVEHILSDATHHARPTLGCFQLGLSDDHLSLSLQIMLACANLRARFLKLPYGDQAYFFNKSDIDRIGGFMRIPLMEDVDLLYRMRPHIVMSQTVVRTSSRRWKRKGVWKSVALNQLYMMAWHLGVSPETIYRWYYGRAAPVPGPRQSSRLRRDA